MYLFTRLKVELYRHLKALSWQGLLIILATYLLLSWGLLCLADEDALTGQDFLYWMVVTASTVGYGDLSPSTQAGRWLTALFIIPAGLSLFAVTIGRVAAFSAHQWRKGIMGLKQLNLDDHILVIGWDGKRTPQLIKLLLLEAAQHRKRRVCLCVTDELENPLPGEIDFVRTESYNQDADMDRACITRASSIVIDTPSDDQTLVCALYAWQRNPKAQIIAYFRDESIGHLLQHHCPSVECAPSVSVEMMAKATMDPGSTRLHQQLLNASDGMTQFSILYPAQAPAIRFDQLYGPMKMQYQATVLGVQRPGDAHLTLNPPLDMPVEPGALLYYIAHQRIHAIDWQQLQQSGA
ncbi:ion channel [Marinobacterium weihaiense]|uniref:NAD-binding protein n=1 Tax=Marinobacterium weihaiense TaxID=2851016 RepID=A0ABS6M9J4_9GAMM|nr:ion channel [Marinobacterium weihaiense]MBV0932952.1 NAD-binding protein [Marinobacterium weihaiense]